MLPQRAACSEKTKNLQAKQHHDFGPVGELLSCLVCVLLIRPALVTQTPLQDLLSKETTTHIYYSGAVASLYKCCH